MGGKTYSKQTGHSKKLAKSVEEVSVVPATDPATADPAGGVMLVEMLLELMVRFLELILKGIKWKVLVIIYKILNTSWKDQKEKRVCLAIMAQVIQSVGVKVLTCNQV